jgi:hypothetical protein
MGSENFHVPKKKILFYLSNPKSVFGSLCIGTKKKSLAARHKLFFTKSESQKTNIRNTFFLKNTALMRCFFRYMCCGSWFSDFLIFCCARAAGPEK